MLYLHFRLHTNYTFFYLERFLKKLADNHCSSITKGSIYHIKHIYVHTTFYYSSGLIRNWMFNGSIYYVLHLQIRCFYFFLGQIYTSFFSISQILFEILNCVFNSRTVQVIENKNNFLESYLKLVINLFQVSTL